MSKVAKPTQHAKSPGGVLVAMALDMSWRLALVVLIPILGGFELDRHIGSSPVLTIIGFLLAMLGMFLVLRRTVANANSRLAAKESQQ